MGLVLSRVSLAQPSYTIPLLKYVTLSGVVYIIYFLGIRPFFSPLRKLPGPPYHPIFGNVREAMVGQAMESSVRWIKKYGRILRFYYMFGREMVLVADPEAFKHIFVTNEDNYDRVLMSVYGRELLMKTLVIVKGIEHKAQRRLLNPLFSPDAVKDYISTFQACGEDLVEFWRKEIYAHGDKSEISVQQDLNRITLDVFGKAVMGYEFNSLHDPDSEVVRAFKMAVSDDVVSYRRFLPFYDYWPTKWNRYRKHMWNLTMDTIKGLLRSRKEEIQNANGQPVCRDLLGRLMLARDEVSGRSFTEQEILAQIYMLILAGHETTTVTMSWLLYLLAVHTDIQEKLRGEVSAVFQSTSRPVTYDQLNKLEYLNCVIKETQRLYPAAPTFIRVCRKADRLGPYYIPAGTRIVVHFGALMRDADLWPDPETFKPERFLEEDNNKELYQYLPFGTGPTKCIGHLFAKLQMRTFIALLLCNFKFSVAPGRHFTRKHRVVLTPVPSMKLMVEVV